MTTGTKLCRQKSVEQAMLLKGQDYTQILDQQGGWKVTNLRTNFCLTVFFFRNMVPNYT